MQRGAEDGEDGAGGGVEDGTARVSAEPQRLGPLGADDEFEGVGEGVEAVDGGVRDGGRAEYARLAPAVGGDPYVCAGLDLGAGRDRQRADAEPFGPYEREAALRQCGDGLGLGEPGPVVGGVQDDTAQPVDGFVTGDDRSVVVGEESGAARPPARSQIRTSVARSPRPMESTVGRR